MNTSMSSRSYAHMMAVTNRHLCDRDFLEQIEFLASTDIDAIILREKDMTPDEYEHLAKDVLMICHEHHKKCILHSFAEVAAKLNCENIHLPLSVLTELSKNGALAGFKHIGTSVHSVEDALAAEKAGATCLTAGHIFDTDCKKGLPGRGLTFLENVCHSTNLPVYAIGGITPENLEVVRHAGAVGGCMMSLSMRIRE